MKAVYASTVNHADPLAALAVGEQPEPQARPFWSTVSVRAVTVNHHDVWSLQGVGLAAEQTPMILGTDAVGILDEEDRKSTRLNSSHITLSRMPSSA